MKVQFLKDDGYKLSEQENALIIETDEFILTDNTGSTYDFDGRDSFLKKHKGKFSLHTKGEALKFDFLAQTEVVVSTVSSSEESAYSDKLQLEKLENITSDLKNYKKFCYELENDLVDLDRKRSIYRIWTWVASISAVLAILLLILYKTSIL